MRNPILCLDDTEGRLQREDKRIYIHPATIYCGPKVDDNHHRHYNHVENKWNLLARTTALAIAGTVSVVRGISGFALPDAWKPTVLLARFQTYQNTITSTTGTPDATTILRLKGPSD